MEILRGTDPFLLFQNWMEAAALAEGENHNAMALATAGADGAPSVRMVLLKEAGPEGFVFYTNMDSRKGRALHVNPRAALCFYWKALGRQVRVEGSVAPVPAAVSDAYFATRPRDSQLGAWASRQSAPLSSREALEDEMRAFAAQFGDGPVPRPPHWGGCRLAPACIEFWQEGRNRLHDRFLFSKAGAEWDLMRLSP